MTGYAVQLADVFCLRPTPLGAVAALRGLTLDVAPGERVVVHGPNGAGKSTLMRVLAGEEPASAGTVQVAGVDLVGADARTLVRLRRSVVGVIEQRTAQTLRPELDVRDNVALQLRLAGRPAGEARTAARDTLDRLGLADLADRRIGGLSAGEAQRVAVAAALAHGPSVVLADEPTGELDRVSADAVYDLLAVAGSALGAALVLVTHDASAGRIADRVLHIRDGRVSEETLPGHAEHLVVDDRGWVRLPQPARAAMGSPRRVQVRADPDGLLLRPDRTSATPLGPVAVPPVARPGSATTAVRLRGVRMSYGDRLVLPGVDLDVAAAQVTVVEGRSGVGKSTLLRIVAGLVVPDAGEVDVLGRPLGDLDRAARADLRRDVVAVVEHDGALADTLDVAANLHLALQLRGLPPDEDLVVATVDALGLGVLRDRPVGLLSGGERQRCAVARALVVQRPVLVLDEPTAQLDEAHAEQMASVLRSAAQYGTGGTGCAVLCASHDPVLLASADRLVGLELSTGGASLPQRDPAPR